MRKMRTGLLFKAMFLFFLLTQFPLSFSRKVFSGKVFQDETVVLELKKSVSDPHGILLSGDSCSSNHCSWYVVFCDSKSRTVSLILRANDGGRGRFDFADVPPCYRRFRGEISAVAGKLSEIRVLSIAFKLNNMVVGELPNKNWGSKKPKVLDLQDANFLCKSSTGFSGLKRIETLNRWLYQIPSNSKEDSDVLDLGFLTRFGMSRNIDMSEIVDLSFIRNAVPRGLVELPTSDRIKLRKLMSLDDPRNDMNPNSDDEETNQSPPDKEGLYPIEIASIASASIIVAVLLVLVVLFFYTRKWKPNTQVQVVEPREIRVFVDNGVPLTYEKLVRATGFFSNSNCIGHGGFGSTYKAEVCPNTTVAVKRLSVGRFQGVQQFHAEISTLEMVRHPNLVTLIGYHASETEMFLIYNYLPGGNLEDFIKEQRGSALEWKTLHKIALDVARALAYLHEQCSPKVLHRDIKPSNILLDNDYNAYLSDFGLSKLLGTSQSHVTTGVAGTFGYVAPEYAMTCRVSEKADVYSYGIVLLELISDKRALDPSFSSHENGFNIVSWAHMMLKQGKAKDVFAKGLWECGPHDDLVAVLHLALMCTVESLSTRPMMKHVVQKLKQTKPTKC